MTTRLLALVAVLLAALPLGGCISLSAQSEDKAPSLYLLNALPPRQSGVEKPEGRPTSLVVELPQVAPGLATDRIALIRGGQRLDYFANARWAQSLPELLQAFFAESLEHRLPRVRVGTPTEVSSADYRLQVAVRDFQAVYRKGLETAPELQVTLVATLSRPGNGKTLVQVREVRERRASANRLGSVVVGLEELLEDAYTAVLDALRPEMGPRG
ncbi:ABC-type transport auxiliary lipoprotein family protein [Thiohalorhabdus sp. Cl-TMA]|uniref:ABC-type transport auxiliary lipoprotein family protein n=1 Tax=Thiohalorhabdus methylotrophus TaxID=3242694 RepID=A0ABV4TT30_9GAMM